MANASNLISQCKNRRFITPQDPPLLHIKPSAGFLSFAVCERGVFTLLSIKLDKHVERSILLHVNCSTRGKMGSLRVIFALFSLVCVFLKVHGATEEIRVDGDDFLAYKMSSIWRLGQRHVKKHTLVFDLKTVHPNGLLIYIGSGEELKDFLMLDLVHGKLRYGIYFQIIF